MKKYFNSTKGFTLIELLVVIGILGILASALIATIDPFEQLKKGQDANVKNLTVEFLNANIRYYTTHNALPWDPAPAGACMTLTDLSAMTAWPTMSSCFGALIADGELKKGFTSVSSDLGKLLVSESDNNITACFKPQSKAQRREPNTKYASDGSPRNDCVSMSGQTATDCYWCAQ